MRHARSRARSWALNLLYGWELSEEPSPAAFAASSLARRRMSPRYRDHVERLLRTVELRLSEIDEVIARHAENWRLERLDVIDRNILRIGIAELRWLDDVPPKTAVHEGVKLATRYGGADSPAFVNGVLDAVLKARESEA